MNTIIKNDSCSSLLVLVVIVILFPDICPDASPLVDGLWFLLPSDLLEGAGHDACLAVRR